MKMTWYKVLRQYSNSTSRHTSSVHKGFHFMSTRIFYLLMQGRPSGLPCLHFAAGLLKRSMAIPLRADTSLHVLAHKTNVFQSSPPIGAETHTSFQTTGSTYPFQPPPSRRRRRIMLNQAASDREFQPSPPVRAETRVSRSLQTTSTNFNPLHPVRVETHDSPVRIDGLPFQPAPSARTETLW